MHKLKLSQEHPTLPLAELKAVLETEEQKASILVDGIDVVLTGNVNVQLLKKRLAMTKEIDGVELEQGFHERYPKRRPFTHPTTLDPKLARCMVNLSRVRKGETLLDPFCGTGGILIEAGFMGFKTIGVDIDQKMVEGCGLNLESYGVFGSKLICDDYFSTKIEANVIVTDPPYGKGTKIKGDLQSFYEKTLEKIYADLKPGKHACISAPSTLNLGEMISKLGFILSEEHLYYINKDLSKTICVIRK